MTSVPQDRRDAFAKLPEAEQLAFAVEVMRWTLDRELPPLGDEELAMAADMIFLELDAREAADGHT